MPEDSDYYSSDESMEESGEKMPMPEDEGGEETEVKAEGPTATVPVEFFAGKDIEPGYECKIKVLRVGEDEVLVEKILSKEKRESEPMSDSMEAMDEMATEDSGY